jgi:hypothetical protein
VRSRPWPAQLPRPQQPDAGRSGDRHHDAEVRQLHQSEWCPRHQVVRPRRLVASGVEDQQQRGRGGRLQQDRPRVIRDTIRVAAARSCGWQRSLPIGLLHRQLLGIGSDRVDALAQRTCLILSWVGFLALFRGFSQIMLAFSIRHASEEAAAVDPAGPPLTRPTCRAQVSPGDVNHHQQLQRSCPLAASRPRDLATSRPRTVGSTRPQQRPWQLQLAA